MMVAALSYLANQSLTSRRSPVILSRTAAKFDGLGETGARTSSPRATSGIGYVTADSLRFQLVSCTAGGVQDPSSATSFGQ
jgi:hypothetical protein